MILMIFMIICVSSCQLITPMPQFQNLEICPPVFIPVNPEESIYKVHCRCAIYNVITGEFEGPFEPSEIKKCDRAYAIVLEDFKEKFQPDMDELQQWYLDLKDKEAKAIKILEKKRSKKKKIKTH